MKKIILLSLLLFTTFFSLLNAQTAQGCDGKRYLQDVFTATNVSTATYGNYKAYDIVQNLLADIYQPNNDTVKKRPLIILAFGGGFIMGKRTDDYMVALSQSFAKKGYVCASIDYRIYDFAQGAPDSAIIVPVIIQAQQDMRAAVRFFKKDAATVNKYAIDTTNIIVAGYSAGAITAMNVGYLSDTTSTIPTWLQGTIKAQGGVEGNSGNAGYTSTVKGVMSMSGGLYKKEWMNRKNAPALVAYHGTADVVLPYARGTNIYNFFTDGDKTCTDFATTLGIPAVLLTVPGGGHTDIYDAAGAFKTYLAQWKVVAPTFLKQLVCGEKINLSLPTEDIIADFKIGLFPNPSQDFINLEIQGKEISNYSAEVVDLSGRIMKKYTGINNTSIQINKSDIGHGLFFVKVTDNSGNSTTQKIVFTN